jgi:Ca2+:H+ antiporter
VQQFNPAAARLQAALRFLGTVALLIPSFAREGGSPAAATYVQTLSFALAILLIAAHGLSTLFSLGTHPELFASKEHALREAPWPMALALGTLAGVTVLAALVADRWTCSSGPERWP